MVLRTGPILVLFSLAVVPVLAAEDTSAFGRLMHSVRILARSDDSASLPADLARLEADLQEYLLALSAAAGKSPITRLPSMAGLSVLQKKKVDESHLTAKLVLASEGEISHANGCVILVDGCVQVGHANNCLIIATGGIDVSHASHAVLLGGHAVQVGHLNNTGGNSAPDPDDGLSVLVSGNHVDLAFAYRVILSTPGKGDISHMGSSWVLNSPDLEHPSDPGVQALQAASVKHPLYGQRDPPEALTDTEAPTRTWQIVCKLDEVSVARKGDKFALIRKSTSRPAAVKIKKSTRSSSSTVGGGIMTLIGIPAFFFIIFLYLIVCLSGLWLLVLAFSEGLMQGCLSVFVPVVVYVVALSNAKKFKWTLIIHFGSMTLAIGTMFVLGLFGAVLEAIGLG